MKSFFESNQCKSGLVCKLCRQVSSAGETYRNDITQKWNMEENWYDKCPRSLSIGWVPLENVTISNRRRFADNLPKHKSMPRTKGVGDFVEEIVHDMFKITIKEESKCGCNSMKIKMNRWGPKTCKEKMDEIVAHLMKNIDMVSGWQKTFLNYLPYSEALAKRVCKYVVNKAIRKTTNQKDVQQQP